MESYKFTFGDKTYELGEDNFNYLVNDEEKPVEGIDEKDIIELLRQGEDIDFSSEYYVESCKECPPGKERTTKYFRFLEYHFYIFTLRGKYILSSLSREYENTSFNRLLKQGRVDDSYIVSIIVCPDCGSYSIEIQQTEE